MPCTYKRKAQKRVHYIKLTVPRYAWVSMVSKETGEFVGAAIVRSNYNRSPEYVTQALMRVLKPLGMDYRDYERRVEWVKPTYLPDKHLINRFRSAKELEDENLVPEEDLYVDKKQPDS